MIFVVVIAHGSAKPPERFSAVRTVTPKAMPKLVCHAIERDTHAPPSETLKQSLAIDLATISRSASIAAHIPAIAPTIMTGGAIRVVARALVSDQMTDADWMNVHGGGLAVKGGDAVESDFQSHSTAVDWD